LTSTIARLDAWQLELQHELLAVLANVDRWDPTRAPGFAAAERVLEEPIDFSSQPEYRARSDPR
jgi:hypothetical protein